MMKKTLMVAFPLSGLLLALGFLTLNPLFSPAVEAQAQATQAAGISLAQAEQAALSEVPGTVLSIQQEDENGVQVYGVIVQAADGSGQWDVKVSAADGQVLKKELDNDNADEGSENEQGDGETDD